jgi:hypothetical protein
MSSGLTTTTIEREHHKQMMIELKEANEKVGKEIIKHYCFDEKAMNLFFDEVWFAKQCAKINETLYIPIRANAPLPSTNYQALICGTKPQIYKFNMKVAMEK